MKDYLKVYLYDASGPLKTISCQEKSLKCAYNFLAGSDSDQLRSNFDIELKKSTRYQLQGEQFYIQFHTDEEIEEKGFVMEFSQFFGGQIWTGSGYEGGKPVTGKVTSPLWPHFYPTDKHITWTLLHDSKAGFLKLGPR